MRLYEKDLIAERDRQQKLAGALIKWWRVNYIDTRGASAIDVPVSRQKQNNVPEYSPDDYNAATGSYSGAYGRNVTLDADGLNQVSGILDERRQAFTDMLENAR